MALGLVRWFEPVLDLVFPVVCPVCLARSDDPAHRPFCGPCWAALPVGLGPGCPVCGEPFPGLGGALPCEACRRTPPPYAFARAVAEYRDGMREAIHALKFGGRPGPGDAARAAPGRGGDRRLAGPARGLGGGPGPGAPPSRRASRSAGSTRPSSWPSRARPGGACPSSRARPGPLARDARPRPTSTRRPGAPTSGTRSGSVAAAAVAGRRVLARRRRLHHRRDRRRRGARAPGGGRGRGRRADPRPGRPALRLRRGGAAGTARAR